MWTPRGAIIRQELQNFISEELRKQGYDQVFTPHIGKLALYKTSGHFPYYKDRQFGAIIENDELQRCAEAGCSCSEVMHRLDAVSSRLADDINQRVGSEVISKDRTLPDEQILDGFMLKPMNCPHHIKIYESQPRSYRDLPVRLAEFGTVYRWEQSGELNGLTRVRGFTQDDAHIFCAENQIAGELLNCLNLVKIVLSTLGMVDYRVRVGLRDVDSDKYIGNEENWDRAEFACRDAVNNLGIPFTEERGEASFYGPKIDFVVKDAIGREWQLGTVQVDYNLPIRFDLSYIGSDNKKHRPVMIHRAPFGSIERFTGILIEHFAGHLKTAHFPVNMRLFKTSPQYKKIIMSPSNKKSKVVKDVNRHLKLKLSKLNKLRQEIIAARDEIKRLNTQIETNKTMIESSQKEREGIDKYSDVILPAQYTKYLTSEKEVAEELNYLRMMQPLDFTLDIMDRGYIFTN